VRRRLPTHHLIAELIPYPNLQIVLTTAWTWWIGDAEVVALLPPALGMRVVANTREFPPQIDEAEGGRGGTGSIIRHATAYRFKKWRAIGSRRRSGPLCVAFSKVADNGA
jgi:hypothetical protein